MPPVRRLLLAAYPIGREVNRQTPACTLRASRREAAERRRKECSTSSPSRHKAVDSVRPLPGPQGLPFRLPDQVGDQCYWNCR